MAAKRVLTGDPLLGRQKDQFNLVTGLVTFTGSIVVNPGMTIRRRGGSFVDGPSYVVQSLAFEDAGGVVTVQRLSSQKNADNTFTINASSESGVAGVWAVSTTPCTVRWTILITP